MGNQSDGTLVRRVYRRAGTVNCKGRALCFLGFGLLFLPAVPANAEVKLPALIGDNMVLQQGKKAVIWGTADPGEEVTVTLEGQKQIRNADAEGRWRVELDPLPAGGPWRMRVVGKNAITLDNIFAGEVWLCSGQSNMEMQVGNGQTVCCGVKNSEQEIATANFPTIRYFKVQKAVAGKPYNEVAGQWVEASPQTVARFSAVAFFFGRELYKALRVPIGLIDSSVGGSPAEAWTSTAALEGDERLDPLLQASQTKVDTYPSILQRFNQEFTQWKESSENAEVGGKPVPAAPPVPYDPRSGFWRATGLYNGMIAPLLDFRIAGMIWYQGESNVPFTRYPPRSNGEYPNEENRIDQYRVLFPALIQDWRRNFRQGDLPFLFVQLANYQQVYSWLNSWAEMREAQTSALSLPKTAMAVAADIGDPDNIHAKNKQEVGRRLALAAQATAYGREAVYSGPVYRSMTVEDGAIRLRFSHLDGGLLAKGGPVKGFEIAGGDHKFLEADADIEGDVVVVHSGKVPNPLAVRYAWTDNPSMSLYNKAGLPAPPFRTDNWPIQHEVSPPNATH